MTIRNNIHRLTGNSGTPTSPQEISSVYRLQFGVYRMGSERVPELVSAAVKYIQLREGQRGKTCIIYDLFDGTNTVYKDKLVSDASIMVPV